MKKIFSFQLLLLLNISVFSQTSPPERISYQGVARDASGNILSGQPINIQFIIHQGTPGGTIVFSEQHSTNTNAVGIFTLQIGSINSSTFQTIPWNNGPFYLEVKMDPTGSGTNYTTVGNQQILSVPYALYAKNSYSAASSYSATYALGSYTTMNAPPITINSSGIVTVSPNTGTNFTVSVPSPTFTSVDNITNITGSYPNYSITTTPTLIFNNSTNELSISGGNTVSIPSSTYQAGNGISISSGSITNTAPDQTVTITPGSSGNISVTGVYPNFTIDAMPTLSIVGNSLSISGGNTVSIPASPVPSITATGITAVTPTTGSSFTISTPSPTFTSGSGISVAGTYPNYLITNTAPNQTVNVYGGTNVNVGGIYPNYTINSTPSLAISGNSLSISNGNTVTLPASNVTITAAGVATINTTSGNNFNIGVPSPSIAASSNTNTGVATLTLTQGSSTSITSINMPIVSNSTLTGVAPVTVATSGNSHTVGLTAQTLTITGNGTSSQYSLNSTYGGLIALPKPTLSINAPHNYALSTGGYATTFNIVPPTLLPPSASTANIASITSNTSLLQYTVNVSPPSLSVTNGVGQSTLSLTQGPVTTTAVIAPSTPTTVTANEWHLTGNIGTNPSSHFIGTADAADLVFRTSNTEKMRISQTGNVGIGTISPTNKLSVIGNIDIPATNGYKYTSPKTYTLSIHPSAFNPESSTVSYTLGPGGFMGPQPVGAGTLITGFACYYQAPLLLPSNATITAIYANVFDNDATYNISQVQIFKSDYQVGTPFGNTSLIGTALNTSGQNPNIQQIGTSLTETVDNITYAYYIRAGLAYPGPSSATIKLGKVIIVYQVLETD